MIIKKCYNTETIIFINTKGEEIILHIEEDMYYKGKKYSLNAFPITPFINTHTKKRRKIYCCFHLYEPRQLSTSQTGRIDPAGKGEAGQRQHEALVAHSP